MAKLGEFNVRVRTHNLDTIAKALDKKVEDLEDELRSDEIRQIVADIYKDCIEPLVPKEFGGLRDSGVVPDDKYKGDAYVLYDAPYAKAQYEGNNGKGRRPGSMWKRHTKNTYDHWNKHLSTADRQAFYDLVEEELIKRLNHGQK